MASGGARANPGPAPDPHALRRDRKDDAAGWTTLPSEGRAGDPPAWPLTEATERENELWWILWRKPQAVLWQRLGQVFEVALHVRCFAEAEKAGAATALRTLVRQQADALLLTIPAMRAARVKIAADEVAEKRTTTAAAKKSAAPASSRSRLRAVKGGKRGGKRAASG